MKKVEDFIQFCLDHVLVLLIMFFLVLWLSGCEIVVRTGGTTDHYIHQEPLEIIPPTGNIIATDNELIFL